MAGVKLGNLEKEIRKTLTDYTEEVEEALEKTMDNLAKEGVKELKATSPERTGDYKKGWARKKQKGKRIIYNKNHYRLTHLLEKGHAKRNGGRVEGIPHIAPVEEQLDKKAVSEFKKVLG